MRGVAWGEVGVGVGEVQERDREERGLQSIHVKAWPGVKSMTRCGVAWDKEEVGVCEVGRERNRGKEACEE